eukprot:6185794-Pleurochrysis_carterae.AAC.1
MMLSVAALLFAAAPTAAYVLQAPIARRSCVRAANGVVMDETIINKALSGELEEEGAENIFLSEVGWATYLDENAKSSYNMNQRPSLADDGYFTPSIFSNPLEVCPSRLDTYKNVDLRIERVLLAWFAVVGAWKDSIVSAISRPLDVAFPTITNDETGGRSYPTGMTHIHSYLAPLHRSTSEVKARTITPKEKDMDVSKRIVGVPGFNLFGSPSSKQ